jgi:hypothetical protein
LKNFIAGFASRLIEKRRRDGIVWQRGVHLLLTNDGSHIPPPPLCRQTLFCVLAMAS